MENKKQNADTPSKSNLIIITPDELLKLGLFKDLPTSSERPPNQIVNSCVSNLKQKIQSKIKTALANSTITLHDEPKNEMHTKQKCQKGPSNSETLNTINVGNKIKKTVLKEGSSSSSTSTVTNANLSKEISSGTFSRKKCDAIKEEKIKANDNVSSVANKVKNLYIDDKESEVVMSPHKVQNNLIGNISESKKEVNIISNTAIQLSSEELRNLVSKASCNKSSSLKKGIETTRSSRTPYEGEAKEEIVSEIKVPAVSEESQGKVAYQKLHKDKRCEEQIAAKGSTPSDKNNKGISERYILEQSAIKDKVFNTTYTNQIMNTEENFNISLNATNSTSNPSVLTPEKCKEIIIGNKVRTEEVDTKTQTQRKKSGLEKIVERQVLQKSEGTLRSKFYEKSHETEKNFSENKGKQSGNKTESSVKLVTKCDSNRPTSATLKKSHGRAKKLDCTKQDVESNSRPRRAKRHVNSEEDSNLTVVRPLKTYSAKFKKEIAKIEETEKDMQPYDKRTEFLKTQVPTASVSRITHNINKPEEVSMKKAKVKNHEIEKNLSEKKRKQSGNKTKSSKKLATKRDSNRPTSRTLKKPLGCGKKLVCTKPDVESNSRPRRGKRRLNSEEDSNLTVVRPLKTYSSKFKKEVANKAETLKDMQPYDNRTVPTATVSSVTHNIDKPEEVSMKNVDEGASEKLTSPSLSSPNRGSKSKLIVVDATPILKDVNSGSSNISSQNENNAMIEEITSLDDKKIVDEGIQESLTDISNGNIEGTCECIATDLSLDCSPESKPTNSSINVIEAESSTEELLKKRRRLSTNINVKNAPIDIGFISSSVGETLEGTRSCVETMLLKQSNKQQLENNEEYVMLKNQSRVLQTEVHDLDEVTPHLVEDGYNKTTTNIRIIPKKRGRPRKDENIATSPQKIESGFPIASEETGSNNIKRIDKGVSHHIHPDSLLKVDPSEQEENGKNEGRVQDSFAISKTVDLNKEEKDKHINVGSVSSSSTNNTMETEVPIKMIPKKRGRPRKSDNAGDIFVSSLSSAANDMSNTLEDVKVDQKSIDIEINTSMEVEQSENVTDNMYKEIMQDSSAINDEGNIENSFENYQKMELNVSSLQKSSNSTLGKETKGRPRKYENVRKPPEKTEFALSIALDRTNDNKIRDTENEESQHTHADKDANREKKSKHTDFSSLPDVCESEDTTNEDTTSHKDEVNLIFSQKSVFTSTISTSSSIRDTKPFVKVILKKKGRPRKSDYVGETQSKIVSSIPSAANDTNTTRQEMEGDEESNDVEINSLMEIDQPEDITDQNIHKKIMRGISDRSEEEIIENFAEPSQKIELNIPSLQKSLKSALGSSSSNIAIEAGISVEKIKKKRGRPRKTAGLEEMQQNIATTSTQNDGESVSSASIVVASAEKEPPEILEESFCGRKRRKINYFELENAEKFQDSSGKRRRTVFISKLKTLKKHEQSTPGHQISDLKISNEDSFQRDEDVNTAIERESSLTENPVSMEGDADKGLIEESGNIKDKRVKKKLTREKNKEVRNSISKKTGETVMMLNSIFSAAFKNKTTEPGVEKIQPTGASLEPSSQLIDRRTKAARNAVTIVIDEDNMVMCMSCGKKINNEEWKDHNRSGHYNLSWREGESEVNMDNTALVINILKPILKEEKYLKCRKCGRENTSMHGYITHQEICTGIVSTSGNITCAVCNTEMTKSSWSFHKQKQHNNLAWRVGEHPLNLNDQNLVMSILNALYKARKPLHCDKCGALKKSVVGFLSHQAQCGSQVEDIKVKCELCERKVLPVSMQSHMKLCHEPKQKDSAEEKSDYFDINLDASLSKRKAATTAMVIIDNFSKNTVVQERNKRYIAQVDFIDELFVSFVLQKELADNKMVKCKFKNCQYETDTIKILLYHMNSCKEKPEQYFVCKKCLTTCEIEDEIKEHIKTIHNIEVVEDNFQLDHEAESDENNDNDDEKVEKKPVKKKLLEKKPPEKDINYKTRPTFLSSMYRRQGHIFSHAFQYTIEFCQKNYLQTLLFEKLRPVKNEWILLPDKLLESYLPQSEESCSVARRRVKGFENVLGREYSFKKYELFEVDYGKDYATIFCGGPINALAWIPTPYTILESRQVLAVAPGNSFDDKFLTNENYKYPSIIEFWDFGVLQNKRAMSKPRLLFCLAFDFGPVWHLEWCPSGCYDNCGSAAKDEETNPRMGLLAVAGSNSCVYIYSIPVFDEEKMGLIYKTKPLLRLQLDFERQESIKREKFFATKISWSMAPGHRYVAVGYTDGMLGLFDLNTESKLLKFKDKDIDVLLPYRRFQAHKDYISALHWVPLGDGNRWLMTTSFDRNVCIWDLSNEFKATGVQKSILTDGAWLSNWISFVTSGDESSTNFYSVHACVQSYRGYMYDHTYLTVSPTTITSVSSSNWLNSIIQCSAEGEVAASFPNEMLFSLDSVKTIKRLKYYLSYTKLIDKYKTPEERVAEEKHAKEINKKRVENPSARKTHTSNLMDTDDSYYSKYEPFNYKEANERYGLLFCDMEMDNVVDSQNKFKVHDLGFSKPNLYSLQKINKVAYNPNRQASLYYATGYQAGFVRVAYIKFLEKDPQIV